MGDLDTRFSEKKIKKSRKANYASPNLATPSACLLLNFFFEVKQWVKPTAIFIIYNKERTEY
jgi:hypothetical protein